MNKEEVMQTYKKNINKINQIKYLKIKNHGDKIKLILKKIQNNNLNNFFVFFKALQNKLYNDIENVLFIPFFYLS
jgi:hypothetical protein